MQTGRQITKQINMAIRTANKHFMYFNEYTLFSDLQLKFEGIKKRTSICSSACAKREIYATHTQRHSHDHDPAAKQPDRQSYKRSESQVKMLHLHPGQVVVEVVASKFHFSQ